MLPYITQPKFVAGPFTIYAFGILVACGLLVGYWITVHRATARGLDPFRSRLIAVLVASSAVVGSWILSLAFFGLSGIYSFGGIYVGLAAAYGLGRWLLRSGQAAVMVDALSFAFPAGWIFGRFGCALSHDHPGIESRRWFAVQYPGGPRLDLGLIEFVFTCLVVALFCYLDRRPRPPGFFLGLFMILYGPFRIVLEQFRAEGGGVNPVHVAFAIASLGLGLSILIRLPAFALRPRPEAVS